MGLHPIWLVSFEEETQTETRKQKTAMSRWRWRLEDAPVCQRMPKLVGNHQTLEEARNNSFYMFQRERGLANTLISDF